MGYDAASSLASTVSAHRFPSMGKMVRRQPHNEHMIPTDHHDVAAAAEGPSAEGVVLVPSITIAGLFAVAFLAFPQQTGAWAQSLMAAIGTNFGWLYLAFGMVALGYCLWLAFGPHGSVKLGGADEPMEFSTPHWVAMMFTAGIGAGTVAWGFGEPIHYLETPPLGIEPYSSEAYEWGHMYPMLHWGIIPWAFYAVPAVPIAYALYVERSPFLRISEASAGVLPRFGLPAWKVIIDIFIVLGIIAGATTSLGIGVPLVSALLSELTGVEDSIPVKAAVLTVWVLLFGASTLRGLKKGIQKLADFNMVLAMLLLLAILVVGPTLFILKMIVNSLGLMADNFFRTSLWTDPINQSGFPENWTVFYWAWWIAFAAFVGLFIARISRGRTIRQLVLGTIAWGALGTLTYLSITGAFALHLELNNVLPLSNILQESGLYAVTATIAAHLPFGNLSLVFFIVLCIVFYATTMDSAAFVAACVCSKQLRASQEPQVSMRVAWISVMFLMTMGVTLSGSLSAVQSLTVIGSLPIIPILIIMSVSLVQRLNARRPGR